MTRYAVLGTSGSTDGGGGAPMIFFWPKALNFFLKITYTSTVNTLNDEVHAPEVQILEPPLLDRNDVDNFVQTDYAFCPAVNFEYIIYLKQLHKL